MEEMRRLEELEEGLEVSFHDQQLLRDATMHDSAVQETLAKVSYERLEFLGDAILGQAIAELTYHEFPTLAEGKLSKIRAAVVNNENLATVARNELHLGVYLLLGKGEKDHGGPDKTSILAGSFEAVLGAIHLDQGPETVLDRGQHRHPATRIVHGVGLGRGIGGQREPAPHGEPAV